MGAGPRGCAPRPGAYGRAGRGTNIVGGFISGGRSLSPLVDFCRVTDRVADSAVFVTSAFGFGNSVPGKNKADRRNGFEADDPGDLLRDPFCIRPFNLDTLLAWTLMAGLKHQDVLVEEGGPMPEAARIARLLARDVEAMDRWIIPIKA